MEPRTFEGIRMTNHFERCPLCSRAAHYSKGDYFFTWETSPELGRG
jgi:hypothetical protein